MNLIPIGRVLRMLRIRRGWRQRDVSGRSGISTPMISRHENGRIGSLAALEKHASVFSLRLDIRLVGRAGALVRLGDEEHAAIVEAVASWFRSAGFEIETEASFSEWGERGRIDLLAFDQATGVLVIVEVKTQLLDLQDLFGSLSVKERLAATVAERRGWTVRRQTVVLAAADTSANREIVWGHPALFATFARRGLSSVASFADQRHILTWVSNEQASRPEWVAGRQRIRRGTPSAAGRNGGGRKGLPASGTAGGQVSRDDHYPEVPTPSAPAVAANSHPVRDGAR